MELCRKLLNQSTLQFIGVFDLALPHDDCFPTGFFQLAKFAGISFDVGIEFLIPKLDSRRRPTGLSALFMLVPKAAVNENCCFVFWKNDVRSTSKPSYVFSETVTTGKEQSSYSDFRSSIFSTDARHNVPSFVL